MKRTLSLLIILCVVLSCGVYASADTYNGFTYTVKDNKAIITKYSGSSTEITVPSTLGGHTVTTIDDGALAYCEKLTSVTIPKTVTKIGEHAFYGCKNLKEIKVGSGSSYFSSSNGVLFNKKKTRLICFPPKKSGSYTMPDTVKVVSAYAFADCDLLKKVTTSSALHTIEDWGFAECDNLSSVSVKDNLKKIGDGAFFNCKKLSSIVLPSTVTNIGWNAFYWCKALKTVKIYNKTATIGSDAFGECDNVSVYCYKNSSAWNYAKNNNIRYISFSAKSLSSGVTVSGVSNRTYTGSKITFSLTVKKGGKTLKKGTDYTVSYKNNKNPGVASIIIKGMGNYKGTYTKTFKIKPKKPTLNSVTSSVSKKATVKYSTYKLVTGYQVQYSTKKDFSAYKYVFVNNRSTSSATLKNLSSKKYYYVRVRCFKTVDGKRIYGGFSNVKKVYVK